MANLQVATCSSSGCERFVISWRGGQQQQKLLSLIVCLSGERLVISWRGRLKQQNLLSLIVCLSEL